MILCHDIHQCTRANFVPILFVVILLVILPLLLVNEHDVHMTHPPLLLVIVRRSLLLFLNDLLLVEMLHLIAIILIMRVDSATEQTDEVSKKPGKLKSCTKAHHHQRACQRPLVHVAGHLVEHQPVTLGAVPNEVLDVAIILILAEISPHLPLDKQVAEPEQI